MVRCKNKRCQVKPQYKLDIVKDTDLHLQFRSVDHTVIERRCNIFEQIKPMPWQQDAEEVKCWKLKVNKKFTSSILPLIRVLYLNNKMRLFDVFAVSFSPVNSDRTFVGDFNWFLNIYKYFGKNKMKFYVIFKTKL